MKKLSLLFALLGVVALVGAAGAANVVSTGAGHGIVIENPTPDNICAGATLKTNDDGSYENGYSWAYAGVGRSVLRRLGRGLHPHRRQHAVCGMKFGLTQVGAQDGLLLDAYVWDAAGTNPGNVLSVTTGIAPGTIGMWPNISQHDIDITDVAVPSDYFVGWWGNWAGRGQRLVRRL